MSRAGAAASLLALATLPRTSAEANVTTNSTGGSSGCPPVDERPSAPLRAMDLNGIAWPELCLSDPQPDQEEEHFFIIGDWGGIFMGPMRPPMTANNARHRPFVPGVDEQAQLLVAEQMKRRASVSKPRYLINVGDNFYWDGINTECGQPTNAVVESTLSQWEGAFEAVYDGLDLEGKVWMGVLGNHDFGGYKFTKGWDQAIAYSWGPGDRWLTPALYWSRRVRHPDFSVDYIFMDSNVNDAFPPTDLPGHNICSAENNPEGATCGATGPVSPSDCFTWFKDLWEEQIPWAEDRLAAAVDSDWRIIVTHFPPDFLTETWKRLSEQYKVDLIITGHRHQQEIHLPGPGNVLPETAWVVSGGGGGITAEAQPHHDGEDDQYGFMDVTIWRDRMLIESISHGGVLRMSAEVVPWHARTTTTITTTLTTITTTTSTSTNTSTTTTTTTLDRSRFHDRHGGKDGHIKSNAKTTQVCAWILIVAIQFTIRL